VQEQKEHVQTSGDKVRESIKAQMEELKAMLDKKTQELCGMLDTALESKQKSIENELKTARERAEKFDALARDAEDLANTDDANLLSFLAKTDNHAPEINLACLSNVPVAYKSLFSVAPFRTKMIHHAIQRLKYRDRTGRPNIPQYEPEEVDEYPDEEGDNDEGKGEGGSDEGSDVSDMSDEGDDWGDNVIYDFEDAIEEFQDPSYY